MTSPFSGKINSLVGSLIYNPELAEKHGLFYEDLAIEQTQTLNKLIWQVWRREISLDRFLAEATKFNLPGFKEKIFPGILRYDFLPLADYLEISINEWLKYLPAGEIAKLNIVSFNKWLEDYLKEYDIILADKSRARLILILKNFIGGNDEEKTVKALSQTEKLGGAGLAESEAEKLVKELRGRFEKAVEQDEIITAQEVKISREIVREEQKISLPAAIQPPVVSRPQPILTPPFVSPIQLYDQIAVNVIKQSGLTVALELGERLKSIIISRLKEVRKIPEARERLMAVPAAGGAGLKAEEAEKLIKIIEEFRTPNSKLQTPNFEEKSFSEKSSPKPFPAPPMPKITEVKQVPPPVAKSVIFQPQPIVKIQPATFRGAGSGSSEFRVQSSPPTSSDIRKTLPTTVRIMPQAKVELIPPSSLSTPPKPPTTVAIPQTPAGRSQVADVVFKPRLVGPIEELKGMTLVDFRRLAPQAKVTADKIYAKIELLAEEDYEKKMAGVKAWQASSVNALYGAILNESIEKAVPVAQVIASRQSVGQETLMPEEFKAVMGLNKRLRE